MSSAVPVAYTVKYGFAPALRKADRPELIARSHGELKRLFQELDSRDLKAMSGVTRRSERREGKISYDSFRTSGDRAVIVARGARSKVEFHCIRTPDGWKVLDMIVRRKGRWTSLVSSLRLVVSVRTMIDYLKRGVVPDNISPAVATPLRRILDSGTVRRILREVPVGGVSASRDRRSIRTSINGHHATISVSAESMTLVLHFTENGKIWSLTDGRIDSGRVHVPLSWLLQAAISWTVALEEWHEGRVNAVRRLLPAWIWPVWELWNSVSGAGNKKSSYPTEITSFLSHISWKRLLRDMSLKSFDGHNLRLSVKIRGLHGTALFGRIAKTSVRGPFILDTVISSDGVISDVALHSPGMSFSRKSASHLLSCARVYSRIREFGHKVMTPSDRARVWNDMRGCVCASLSRRIRSFSRIYFPFERLVPRLSRMPAVISGVPHGQPSDPSSPVGVLFAQDESGPCVSGLYVREFGGLDLARLAAPLSTLMALYEGLASDSPELVASTFEGSTARQVGAGLRRLSDFKVPLGTLVRQWTRFVLAHRNSSDSVSISKDGRSGRFRVVVSGREQWTLSFGDMARIQLGCTPKTCVISGGYVYLGRRSKIPLLLAARIFPASMAMASGLARGRVRRGLLRAFSSRQIHFVWKLLARQGGFRKYIGWYDLQPSKTTFEAGRLFRKASDVLSEVKTVWNPSGGWAEFHIVSGRYGRSVVYFVRDSRGYWVLHDAAGTVGGRRIRLSSLGRMGSLLTPGLRITLPRLGF